MPPLLAARNLPQTLLLTALFLLIVVATTMLACGPVEQPAPAADGALPAAQQSDGGDELPETPMETPTDAPTVASAGDADTPTPEPDEVADTPAPGNTDTPTPESKEPTATPTAEPEAPAATPTPTPEPAESAATPTPEPEKPDLAPRPTPKLICYQEADGEFCFEEPPHAPTPKYPVLRDFSRYAQEAEEALANPGQSAAKVRKVFVRISLSSGDSGAPMLAWLQSNGVPLTTNWTDGIENNLAEIYGYGFEPGSPDGYIYAIVPASLLFPLSQQPGFAGIEDACRTFRCQGIYAHNTHRDAN